MYRTLIAARAAIIAYYFNVCRNLSLKSPNTECQLKKETSPSGETENSLCMFIHRPIFTAQDRLQREKDVATFVASLHSKVAMCQQMYTADWSPYTHTS